MRTLRPLPLIAVVGAVVLGLLGAAPATARGPVTKFSGHGFSTMAGANKYAKQAPQDLKAFLVRRVQQEKRRVKQEVGAAEYDRLARECREASDSPPVHARLTAHHRKGFALGDYVSCVGRTGDGGVLRKRNGTWRIVVHASQSVPACAELKKFRVPASLWKVRGGKCYDRNADYVTYQP